MLPAVAAGAAMCPDGATMCPDVATGAAKFPDGATGGTFIPVQAQVKVWSAHSQVLLPMFPAVAIGAAMCPDGAAMFPEGAAMCPDVATGGAMFPAVAAGTSSIMLVPVQAQVNVPS